MDFIFTVPLIVMGVLVTLAYAKMRSDEALQIVRESHRAAIAKIESARADLENSEKHIAHAISEIQILKGGMMENDELIDDLYEQGKKVASVVQKLEQPKRKSGRIVNKLKKTQATSVKIKSPKDMVFHMSNKQKLSRRSK